MSNIDIETGNSGGRVPRTRLNQNTKDCVVYISVVVSSLIALIVILSVALMPFIKSGFQIPQTLTNWGGIIIGFYFGSFVSILKDWL
ncbi:MAG: hypothetical protein OXC63_11345 [Aestuariivita sp.]|nr:hypothetical protein [Aestuariivita sp.]MCY4347395.1 hypothetical protein [Aestuariivita sp.]